MPEYIEREALLERNMYGNTNPITHRTYAKNLIESAPAADVVEVVRCKDCEHRYVPCHCALWYGTANGTEYFIERGDDFSCSYGKRKEGAEE